MKNVTIQVAREISFVAKIRQSAAAWLSRTNNLFTALVQERVTNRQALLASNFFLSCIVAFVAFNGPIWAVLASSAWSVYSFSLMKKGGLLND